MKVWDLPTRLFHWALALSFIAAWGTAQLGTTWMNWHLRAGYVLAGLLLFRIVWGLVGSDSAQFHRFLKGPRAVAAYLSGLTRRDAAPHPGHNPAGGWMAVLMLTALAVITLTGLFADDLILYSGPLATCVTVETSDLHTRYHLLVSNVALALVGLHLLAIAVYTVWLRQPLLHAMITGQRPLPCPAPPRLVSTWRAVWVFALTLAAMWALSEIRWCG